MANTQKTIIICTIAIVYIGTKMGDFVDITTSPKKSDIIVSLGGDQGCRIMETLKLYHKGFSNSNKIIYTGSDKITSLLSKKQSRYEYFKNNNILPKNIIHINGAVNTMEELFYIKKYMLLHHYKSVLFVSHPFHSKRISILAEYIAKYKQAGISVNVVGCKLAWWDRESYYLHKKSIIATTSETVKLIYNLMKYSPIFFNLTAYAKKDKQNIPDKIIKKLN